MLHKLLSHFFKKLKIKNLNRFRNIITQLQYLNLTFKNFLSLISSVITKPTVYLQLKIFHQFKKHERRPEISRPFSGLLCTP